MAAAESSSGGIKMEELEDITSCCICTEVFTDPKALPCIHTFCMKCLRDTGSKSNKGPGDEMPCPICRRMFKIPTEGFHGLPKNFFIEKLIQVSRVSDPSAVSRALCSVCLGESEGQADKETAAAETYCVECKHKLCSECHSEHTKFKVTKNHKLIPINEFVSDQNLLTDIAPSVCEGHEQNILNVYCVDCKTVVCAICFIEDHKNHDGSHVNKWLDGFRKQLQNSTEAMNGCKSQAQVKKAELLTVKEEIQQRAESLESDVEKRKNEIKQLTDKHASRLLQGLCSERQSRLKEIQMATDDIDAYLSNLASYNSYCQSIVSKGSASDICNALSHLSVRELELQKECQPIIQRRIPEFKFRLIQSELHKLLWEECGNLVGEIEEDFDLKSKKRSKQIQLTEQSKKIDILRKENDKLRQELDAEKAANNSLQTNYDKFVEELNMYKYKATLNTLETNSEKLGNGLETTKEEELRYKSDPVLVQTIRTKVAEKGKKWIRGLTILDKELFVVSETRSEVEVYDSMKFSFSRRWKLKELIHPVDMGSCNRNKCLYILDFKGSYGQSDEILRIFPNGKLVKNWSTQKGYAYGLSVTDESNVILTICNRNKLNEYSPDGELVREINLPEYAGIRNPWHAIKLTNGNFVVSYGFDYLHRVCIVDADGKLKKSFGGRCGSAIGKMNRPGYLSIDENGFVIVADQWNSRVLLLDSNLEFKRVIVSNKKHGIRFPQIILLDGSNGRLFVADNDRDSDGQILVFDF